MCAGSCCCGLQGEGLMPGPGQVHPGAGHHEPSPTLCQGRKESQQLRLVLSLDLELDLPYYMELTAKPYI